MSVTSQMTPSTSVAAVSDEDIEQLPGRIAVERAHGGLTLTYRWKSKAAAAASIAAAVAFFAISIGPVGFLPWMFLIGFSPFILAFVGSQINQTKMVAEAQGLHIHRGPIPWPGFRWLYKKEIEQLFVQGRELESKGDEPNTIVYDVVARSIHGKDIVLIKSLETASQGHTIQAILAPALDLEHVPASGARNESAMKA